MLDRRIGFLPKGQLTKKQPTTVRFKSYFERRLKGGEVMMKSFAAMALLAMLMAVSYGSDWLEGGSVGRGNYGEIQQYFTDPIFSTQVPVSPPGSFYQAHNKIPLKREPLYLGKYAVAYQPLYQNPSNVSIFPSTPWQSEFRNSSLAAMESVSFQTNWTSTLVLARTKSSLKVLQNGIWKSI
jgi:hypothetical protein